MANDQDFMRWARASRSAQADDNVVVLNRPLGLVLNEDEQGNVYVETVAPKGNAARTGKVSCVLFFGLCVWLFPYLFYIYPLYFYPLFTHTIIATHYSTYYY